MIVRSPDWQERLARYLVEAARTPWGYGALDCALFAAGGVAAMTGRDLALGYRGNYGSFKGGLKALRKRGHRDHLALVEAHFKELPVAFARPGDLAAVPTTEGLALGIVQGEGIYLASEAGLRIVPLVSAARAWKVG